jgi:hypothetical protein
VLGGPSSVFSSVGIMALILAVCDFCHARRWYNRPDLGVAMAERDLTAREDRFIALCLVAAAIIVVFAFIVSYA